jgi:ubiquinone/menaquinone biosynthesis C-methylase UbiE
VPERHRVRFLEAMLEKFRENAAAKGVENAFTIRCDLRSDPLPSARYDIVVCSMTLHHVEDIAELIGKFALLLRPGGTVALVDLEKEDGPSTGTTRESRTSASRGRKSSAR